MLNVVTWLHIFVSHYATSAVLKTYHGSRRDDTATVISFLQAKRYGRALKSGHVRYVGYQWQHSGLLLCRKRRRPM